MKELLTFREVEDAADGDAHPIWTAQGQADGSLGPGVRAWAQGAALAVASPDVSGRDRMAVVGPDCDAVPLARHVLDEVDGSYRLFGAADLMAVLVQRVDELALDHTFYWMDTAHRTDADRRADAPSRPGAATDGVRWLDAPAEKEATALFDAFFPGSYARPGREGVRRWARVLDPKAANGGGAPRPLAVAADAWSARGCGFMAGVVTHEEARGRGLAGCVCGFLADALVANHGRAALMVDQDNGAAVSAYERIGMVKHLFGAVERTGRR